MKRIAFLLIVASLLGGCTITSKQVSDAIAKIEAGLTLLEHEARDLADLTCSQYLPAANAAAIQITAAFPSPGPNTRRYLADMNRALGVGSRACQRYQATSGASLIALAKQAYGAYLDWQVAKAQAQAAGGL